jgi:hypothetical protein
MMYISQRIPILNAGTLDVVKSVLSSTTLSDIARTELDAIDRHIAELASGPTNVSNTSTSSTCPPKVEQLQALLSSIFPEPEELALIESILGQGTSFPGTTVCQFIRERVSQ